MMKKTLVIFLAVILGVACFVAGMLCRGRDETDLFPKYGDKEMEVLLPQSVLSSVNCSTLDFRIPWYDHHEDATVVLLARQQSKEVVVRLRSANVTHEIVRFEYVVTKTQEGKFPESVLSFLTFKTYEDGSVYKDLGWLPEQCKFFLASDNDKHRILSIEKGAP